MNYNCNIYRDNEEGDIIFCKIFKRRCNFRGEIRKLIATRGEKRTNIKFVEYFKIFNLSRKKRDYSTRFGIFETKLERNVEISDGDTNCYAFDSAH